MRHPPSHSETTILGAFRSSVIPLGKLRGEESNPQRFGRRFDVARGLPHLFGFRNCGVILWSQ
jgi:hypothetical protein